MHPVEMHMILWIIKTVLSFVRNLKFFMTLTWNRSFESIPKIQSFRPQLKEKQWLCVNITKKVCKHNTEISLSFQETSATYRFRIPIQEQNYMESVNVDHNGRYGRPSASPGTMKQVKQLFQNNLYRSIWVITMYLFVARLKVHWILREVFFFSVQASKSSRH